MLELGGNETGVAHSGPEALEILNRVSSDIALCHIGMSGINTYEVRQRVPAATQLSPSGRGHRLGGEDDKGRAKTAGFDFDLAKPAHIAEVERLIAAREVAHN